MSVPAGTYRPGSLEMIRYSAGKQDNRRSIPDFREKEDDQNGKSHMEWRDPG